MKTRLPQTTTHNRILILGLRLVLAALLLPGICKARTAAVASFVGSDTTTEGNWRGLYGANGYALAGGGRSIPSDAVLQNWYLNLCAWTASSTGVTALEASSGSGRVASAWCGSRLTFYLNLTDGQSHSVALYALDWNLERRAETIQIFDRRTNALLDARSISGFSSGVYLVWNVTGNVRITVTATAGPNAAISGVFFGAGSGSSGSTSPPSGSPAAGTGNLSVNPSSFNFGSVNVGSVASQSISVTNSGSAGVTVSGISISGPGFNANGASGAILSPGQSTKLNVTFAPASTGSVTGRVMIPSNAANSPASIGLSGTGVQPPAPSYSVMLTWAPGSSSGVAGYYVFRSLAGGRYTQLTTALVTATTYTDTTVQPGQTYDYEVTSVGSSNVQSAYSNVASASIP